MGTENSNTVEGEVIVRPPSTKDIVGRHLELPSGGWMDFRDPNELRAKDRKRAMASVNDDSNRVVTALEMTDALGMMLVEKFSLPYPPFNHGVFVELTASFVDDLSMPDYDAMVTHVTPAIQLLFPGKASVDNTKPGSPTQPAGD